MRVRKGGVWGRRGVGCVGVCVFGHVGGWMWVWVWRVGVCMIMSVLSWLCQTDVSSIRHRAKALPVPNGA